MGTDKALVAWQGVPMASRVAAALGEAGCHPVVAIGGDAQALSALGFDVVADRWPGEGPLGGVITALRHLPGEVVMVVSCDLPRLSSGTVRTVLAALGGNEASVPLTDRPESLCAAWSRAALPALEAAFEQGERSLRGVLDRIQVVHPRVDRQDLTNVNTPRDLHD